MQTSDQILLPWFIAGDMVHNIDLIFWTAGVTEVELAPVVTNDVECVVFTGRRDKKAPCAAGEMTVLKGESLGHVGPHL